MTKNSLLGVMLLFISILTGCSTTYDNYHTQVNPYEINTFSEIAKGMTTSQVHEKLGMPVFKAQLEKTRTLERYYTEKMKYQRVDGDFIWAYINYRDTEILDVWYEKGKVKEIKHFSRNRAYQYDEKAKLPRLYERSVASAITRPYPLVGTAYDFQRANKVKQGQTVSDLLWSIGVPNRIVATGAGEKFIYEYGDFVLSDSDKAVQNYSYSKSVYTIYEGEINKIDQFDIEINLSEPNKSDEDFLLFFEYLFKWHAKGIDFYEDCLEKSTTQSCEIDHYRTIVSGDWKNYPDLVALSYYVSDFDMGNIRQDKEDFYEKVVAFSNNENNDLEIELFYILRSSIGSGLVVGKDSLDTIFAGELYHPYKKDLNSDKGTLAKVWLNSMQPNKWYFDHKGQLNAKLSFSLLSPMSPWYMFGPTSKHSFLFSVDDGIEDCSRTSSNCVKALDNIYPSNLVYPHY